VNESVDPATIARLHAAAGFVFDLDGSLVLGDKHNRGIEALPGAAHTLRLLDERGVPWVVLTNGTVRVPAGIAAALGEADLDVPAERILTPATVAAEYFLERGMRRILVLGVEGAWRPLADAGLEVLLPQTGAVPPPGVDAVFVGWYREFHMDHIEAACDAVWNGAKLYAASMVPFFATRGGRALGSSRAICTMITGITGKRGRALGKPSAAAMRSAVAHLGCAPADAVVLGDDPGLEVAMARRAGALAVGVHSGIASEADFAAADLPLRAHLSLPGVADLYELLAGHPL
jgi:HAD superfamily hydrolase (TIGR01450 family)